VQDTRWSLSRGIGLTLVATIAIACTDGGPQPVDDSPLAGLSRTSTNDSTGAPPPNPPSTPTPTPGYVRGTILAPSPDAPPGTDTLATATRFVGAKVTAYPRLRSGTDTLGVGPMAAQVETDAKGEFQLPVLPGGEYVITFNPPPSQAATYGGVWTVTTIHSMSHEFPWWIVLWKK
jgi:hypothetical protein